MLTGPTSADSGLQSTRIPPPHAAPTDWSVVRAADVSRTFGSGAQAVVAVHGANFEIAPGDRIAIVGPSGSGKSTLAHLIAGLDRPTTGTLEWPAIGPSGALRPGPIAVVFQAPSLLPALDVRENVMLPLLLANLDRDVAAAAAERALEQVDMRGLAAKLPDELSAGQAQRIAVARAIASDHRLLIADEPTGQLDHVNAGLVVDALLESTRAGAALLVITHDPNVAGRLPRRWTMHRGRLIIDNANTSTARTQR